MDTAATTLTPATAPQAAAAHPPGCNCPRCSSQRVGGPSPAGNGSTGRASDTVTLSGAAPAKTSEGPADPRDARGQPLDDRKRAQLDDLKKTDADVRRHEQAHLSAAGGLARGGIVLDFKPGPDGKLYAVGGHVDVDTSPVQGDPTATIAKMATVERAALAPSDPSGQDRSVAAQAARTANNARAQLSKQQGAGGKAGAGGAGDTARTGSSGAGMKLTTAIGGRQAGSADPASAAGQLVDVMG